MTKRLIPLICLATTIARAEPIVMPQFGYLLEPDDRPYAGTATIAVRLYPRSDAGLAEKLWEDTFETPVAGGYYALQLGDVRAGRRELRSEDLAGERWLGLTVNGGAELQPRLRLGRVASAVNAAVADVANTLSPSATIEAAKVNGLAKIATSGAYADLAGAPVLADVATSGAYADLTGAPALAAVASSGKYSDLQEKPALAAVATSGAYGDLSGKPTLAVVATSGAYGDLSGKPALAAVATSGAYSDLTGKPDLAGFATLAGNPTFTGTLTSSGAFAATGLFKLPATSPGACNATNRGAVWFDPVTTQLWACAANDVWVQLARGQLPTGESTERAAPSCAAILAGGYSTGSKAYWVDDGPGGAAAQQVWCDMTTAGGGWTVPVFQGGHDAVTDPASYQAFCTAKGFPLAGRGAEAAGAWLVQKRMLWASTHALRTAGWPNGAAHVAMPVMKPGNDASALVTIFDRTTAARPANLFGDHCDSNTGEHYCGYWYANGWSDANQDAYPDPEDWSNTHDTASTWFSCLYR